MNAGLVFTMLWGLLVFASWVGWGRLAERWLGEEVRGTDVGLTAGWGMCLTLFAGGILNATRMCSLAVVVALVAAGVAILIGDFIVRRSTSHDLPPHLFGEFRRNGLGLLPIGIVLGAVYVASLRWTFVWSAYDDFPAYTLYPVKMLQAGCADDPFSLRRLSTLGGYSFLQAETSFAAWPAAAFQVDVGLGTILLVALILGFQRRSSSRALQYATVLAALMMPIQRINTMCTTLGIAGFILLFRTLHMRTVTTSASAAKRLPWITGLVVAGLTTLRPNFLPTAVLAVLFTAAFDFIRRGVSWRRVSGDVFCAALATGAGLLPWSLALHRAAGSFFFPLMKGNYHAAVELLSINLAPTSLVAFVFFFFLQGFILTLVGIGALTVFGLDALPIWMAVICGTVVTIAKFTLSDYGNLCRYVGPSLAAAAIVTLMCIQLNRKSLIERRVVNAAVIVASLFLFVTNVVRTDIWCTYEVFTHRAHSWVETVGPRVGDKYAAAQSRIPSGKRVLAVVEFPYLFDQRRDEIFSVDLIGVASPGAGLPLRGTSDQLLKYLRDESVDYLICEKFTAKLGGLYSEPYWSFRSSLPPEYDPQVLMDYRLAYYQLTGMRLFDALLKASPTCLEEHGFRILRLR